MRCREARALLSAGLDDELTVADVNRLEHHLAGCSRCRSTRESYESLRAQLRVSKPLEVDLVPALRDRLSGRPAPAEIELAEVGSRITRRSGLLVAAAAATIVVILAVAFVATDRRGSNFATKPPRPVPELHAPGGASLLLAWTTGGLPEGAAERTRGLVGVTGLTEVRGSELRLTGARDAQGAQRLSLPAGAAIPIDALAIDPPGYARNLPASAAAIVRALPRDGALLGATSARLRGIGPGGSLTFGATTVRVTAVLADSLVGAAEVVVRDDSPLTITTPRFLLIDYRGDRSELETAIGNGKRQVRFRAPGETSYLRHGDAVLPQAIVKARFGEFWYRVDARGAVTIDPRWVADNIVTVEIPGVGRLRCHRLVAASLRRALGGSVSRPPGSAVAFAPQLISPSLGLSRHTWGIGLTLPSRPEEKQSTIARLAGAGFTWGGLWLNPSPDYYEWIGSVVP
ncbi:MAG: hypothetical protein QOF28_366 [Actinomycetota bacterium]|nr:hypothetical protein [Actinomycetota bacterium]